MRIIYSHRITVVLIDPKVIILNRATTSIYDGIVLISTILRTLRVRQQALRLNVGTGLIGLLLRDGSLYFG